MSDNKISMFINNSLALSDLEGYEWYRQSKKVWDYMVERNPLEILDVKTIRHLHKQLLEKSALPIAGGVLKNRTAEEALKSILYVMTTSSTNRAVRENIHRGEITRDCHVAFMFLKPFKEESEHFGRMLYMYHRFIIGLDFKQLEQSGVAHTDYMRMFRGGDTLNRVLAHEIAMQKYLKGFKQSLGQPERPSHAERFMYAYDSSGTMGGYDLGSSIQSAIQEEMVDNRRDPSAPPVDFEHLARRYADSMRIERDEHSSITTTGETGTLSVNL